MAALIRALRRAAGPLAAVLALALAGCANPFEPATPEPPDPSGIREDFSTPAKLLATLIAAIENKGPAGRLAWTDAMADSTGPDTRAFYAFHDPRVLSAWRLSSPVAPPEPWDLELEKRFYDRFIALYDGEYVMAFDDDDYSPNDVIDEAAGTALLHRKYYIAATVASSATVIAIGYVDLYMVKYDGRWFVIRWEDRLDPLIGVDPVEPDNVTLGWRRLESVSS
jgi:hypothetical protein